MALTGLLVALLPVQGRLGICSLPRPRRYRCCCRRQTCLFRLLLVRASKAQVRPSFGRGDGQGGGCCVSLKPGVPAQPDARIQGYSAAQCIVSATAPAVLNCPFTWTPSRDP